MDQKLIVPKNPNANITRLKEEHSEDGCCKRWNSIVFVKGVSQKLEYIVIVTPFSLKIQENDSRTRQDSCISLLPEKEVEDIRIGMNGNISR